MSISLDTLLFWCGLALLSIGLIVFLTGKRASDESKKESNRFEAFGIKIDVNNPSLILIMLGVVLMLAPKFMPQAAKETKLAGSEQAQPLEPTAPPAETADPPVVSIREEAVPSPSRSEAPAATAAQTSPIQVAPKTLAVAPATAPPPKPPTQASVKKPAAPSKRIANLAPAASQTEPPAPAPEPTPPPPSTSLLMVSVVADVSDRAGIRESAKAYARHASETIAQRANEVFRNSLKIDLNTERDLRSLLQEEGEGAYGTLCSQWQADVLLLGDFRITAGWSSIDSAYWPDYHLHLYHCGTQRKRQEVFKHLNPSNRDSFPFQQAIDEKTMKFLTDSRWVVGN